jgi:hypothetical protein
MMQCAALLGILTMSSGAAHLDRRANFVRVTITAPRVVALRAIWRAHSGGTAAEQQMRLLAGPGFGRAADSTRRWRDPSARDTVVAKTPAEFVVDMTSNTVVIETVTADSVQVEAQLTPTRGPIARKWGRALRLESDGRTPTLERIR